MKKAFTITELLVVILLVGVVLALALPPIVQARVTARRLKCVVQARTTALLVHAYAADNQDFFPFGGWTREPRFTEDMPMFRVGGDWGLDNGTWAAMFPEAWSDGLFDRQLMCPMQPRCNQSTQQPRVVCIAPLPFIWMSSAMWYDASTLADDTQTPQVRPNRVSDVWFPSDKSLFFEQAAFCNTDPESQFWLQLGQTPFGLITVAYVDGSAHRVLAPTGQPCIRSQNFDCTTNGVRGIDRPR